jgi:uncharacterized protein (UPF0548 family)
MLSRRKPSPESLRRFLDGQARLDFSYAAVGATAHTPPPGYVVDRTQVELGTGAATFVAARAALERWEQFQLGWVEAWPTSTPLQPGAVIAVLGRAVGLWWLNASRIIYVVDETGPVTRFGFAYGTLPAHVEQGEERFLIEWDRTTDRVAFDIFAFSRPQHPLTRLGYPLVRRSQKRFGRESAAHIFHTLNGPAPRPEIRQTTE